ncbi:holo-ACP synthase [Bacillus cereus]|uniref:holo-ACP synthase n=1 Tax=Bacillus cereus TaxID=1396 RepID=UPI00027AA085|nr:4'-phosphopantetheinyl transferase superfamily protein [Bacillus cereus]EJS63043.1 phosphopantetheine-protein transferase domain protein [Bacillus cereus BAG2X1-1]EJS69183.1 phosphopantetheine-protein transferase domain protein [Bacillus cereus BAG2X1-3]
MIKGIGIDITEIERWKNKKTLRNLFTEQELMWAKENYLYYAIMWCIKEATVKAIGTGFQKNIMWNDIEVLNIDGEYKINFSTAARETCQITTKDQFHIDVTRNDTSVISQVIWSDTHFS